MVTRIMNGAQARRSLENKAFKFKVLDLYKLRAQLRL